MRKFFWGAATSAHQVEGGNSNDWTLWEKENAERLSKEAIRRPPDGHWPEFLLKSRPNPLHRENYLSGKAAKHYNLFEEDFDIAQALGHNAHRFSIEWSRVEPEEGVFDKKAIEHYKEVARALRERGLEPFATLWHFTLPLWLTEEGGAESEGFTYYFGRYAEKIAAALKNDVIFWITLNEPEIYCLNAYLRGLWPPGKKSILSSWRSQRNIASAHRAAYRAIKSAESRSHVGASLNQIFFESAGGPINDLLKWGAEKLWNHRLIENIRTKLDFVGVNYYFHNRIDWGFNKNKNEIVSDMNWEIYPHGLYRVLKNLKRFGLPIYITENGVADARDLIRADFIKNHVESVKKAKREGVDVRGYFYWSLLDNFEWDKGFWPRFGLTEVNYKTFQRKIRPSAWIYKEIIEKNPECF